MMIARRGGAQRHQNLRDWPQRLGLGKYETAFRETEIDETILPNLTVAASAARPRPRIALHAAWNFRCAAYVGPGSFASYLALQLDFRFSSHAIKS
jgi:hypothetical protein